MRKFLWCAALLLCSGCINTAPKFGISDAVLALGPEWRPLQEIRERPYLLRDVGSDTATTTVGKVAYVRDLEEWMIRVPAGSPKFNAILRHEQEHSKRQLAAGTYLWIAKYSYDTKFALLEEQIGYYYELTVRRQLGGSVKPEAYAVALSSYENLAGKLISYEDALAWVRAVLSGSWSPPE